MKIIRFNDIAEVPASHEDAKDPGVVKKVLFRRDDLFVGRVQMINWAMLLPGKTFAEHYHEDMQEVFIRMADGVVSRVDGKEVILSSSDALVVESRETHEMRNTTSEPIDYIVVGIAADKPRKSVSV